MVVVILIENNHGEFLMQKRSPKKGGYWAVTGGHPKSGENPIQGIATEVLEELGIDISNENLVLFDEGCDDVAWMPISEIKSQIEKKTMEENQIYFYERCFNY